MAKQGMKLASFRKFEVTERNYKRIKKLFGNYVFNRKDENGCFVKLSRSQEKQCRAKGLIK